MDTEDKNGFNVLDLIKTLSGYTASFTFLIIYIGFIYMHAKNIPYHESISVFDIPYEVLPVSLDLYVINGVLYSVKMLLGLLFAGLIWGGILEIKILNKFENYLLQNYENDNINRAFRIIICGLIYIFPVIVTTSVNFFILEKCFNKDKVTETPVWLLESLTLAVFFLTCLFVYHTIIVLINNKKNERSFSKGIELLYCGIVVLGSFTMNIYFNGLFVQAQKINNAFSMDKKVSDSEHVKMAMVYREDGSYQDYVKIDVTKDTFIGWNYATKSIDVIPMGKIKQVSIRNGNSGIKVKKYNGEAKEATSEQRKVAETVNSYYIYGLDKQKRDAKKFLGLLSTKFYQSEYDVMSPETLKKGWDAGVKESKEEKFIAQEISLPEISDNTAKVYVIEYWSDKNKALEFSLVKENGLWKIDNKLRKDYLVHFTK